MLDTELVKIDVNNIDHGIMKRAGAIIRRGGLVAFPTETVYGLGANGLDGAAAGRIFEAKGRPSDNPLILHISDVKELDKLVRSVPDSAVRLIDRFWPGPMTLVMDKSSRVPEEVTAGLDTVAVRMPDHEIAILLIRYAGVPIAAPSANISGKPSPTVAEHVMDDLMGRVDMIIDGGRVSIGVESTVIDVTCLPVTVLRPGGITLEQIREVAGDVSVDPALADIDGISVPRSPGMKYTHYSPEAQVIIIDGKVDRVAEKIKQMTRELEGQGRKVGILATEQTRQLYSRGVVIPAGDREAPGTIAARLFSILREFDKRKVDVILAESVEEKDMGLAVMNRLLKSAGYNVIKV